MKTVKGMDDIKRLAHCKEDLNSDLAKNCYERKNNLSHNSINIWLRIFGLDDKPIDMAMRSVKSDDLEELRKKNEELRIELAQLKKKLEYAEMGRDAYDCMIDLAEKQFKIPIRKKLGAK